MKVIVEKKEKAVAQHEKEIKTNLTAQTIKAYSLGKIKEANISIKNIPPIDLPLTIVIENKGTSYFQSQKRIESSAIDEFLFSGRYNSVVGPDGFKNFKDNLKTLVDAANNGISKENLINLDEFFKLSKSGIYYEANYLSDNLEQDYGANWLTAYRFISKNLPSVTYGKNTDNS